LKGKLRIFPPTSLQKVTGKIKRGLKALVTYNHSRRWNCGITTKTEFKEAVNKIRISHAPLPDKKEDIIKTCSFCVYINSFWE
jgi:hypothetical protein